ncbi:MAG TPA: hypothetical protein VM099_17245 [Gemmatimonadaceae bacterium]|nr:hypothetical protein [Gemmatimonadaceae bacterium]
MKLEQIPVLLGIIVLLIALAIAYDAMGPAEKRPFRERRRRQRADLNRGGELLVAMGTASLAAALIGRDSWRYGTIAVFLGAALLIIGAALNRPFLRELLFFRGASRRAPVDDSAPPPTDAQQEKLRIR